MDGRWQFSLRQMLLALTCVAIGFATLVGLVRFGNSLVKTVERDYWQDRIAERQYPPGEYPASLFTEQEIAELRVKTEQINSGDTSK